MTETPEEQGWATAKTLAEALPYIQRYDRETVVIKYGGHAMGEESVARLFAADAEFRVHLLCTHYEIFKWPYEETLEIGAEPVMVAIPLFVLVKLRWRKLLNVP